MAPLSPSTPEEALDLSVALRQKLDLTLSIRCRLGVNWAEGTNNRFPAWHGPEPVIEKDARICVRPGKINFWLW